MIQKEYFEKAHTKELLSLRRESYCSYPRFDGDDGVKKFDYQSYSDSTQEEFEQKLNEAIVELGIYDYIKTIIKYVVQKSESDK